LPAIRFVLFTKRVEGVFCEVELPLYGVLRSSLLVSNAKLRQR
jgi:hypothetical protein